MSKVLSQDEAFVRCLGSANSFIWFRAFAPLPYHVKLRRWMISKLPSLGSFAVSKGVSSLQSFSGSCLRCHGCIGGGARSLASCIACPTCLRDSIHAEVLRDNIADAQEHPSYGNWAGGIVKQYSRLGMVSPFSSSGTPGLNSPRVSGEHEGSALQGLGGSACVPKNSSLKLGKALHMLCMVSASQSAENCALL